MSSKYSEFRKTKQVTHEHIVPNPGNIISEINMQQINQMMQVLNSPVNLRHKQSNYNPKRQQKSLIIPRNTRKYQSAKNSQTNQSQDLTTTVDQQSTGSYHNAKLPIILKSTTKRRYTQEESQGKNTEPDFESPMKTEVYSQKNEQLLYEIQQKEETQNINIGQLQKSKIFQKLAVLQSKLADKDMNSSQMGIILDRLNKIEALIDQL